MSYLWLQRLIKAAQWFEVLQGQCSFEACLFFVRPSSHPPLPWDWELGTEKVYPALDLAEALEAASMNPTARAERSGKFHGALDES